MAKVIQVKVIPRSKQAQVIEDLEGNLRVRVKSPPDEGRANKELIELLSKYYKVAKNQIEIAHGNTSRCKTIKLIK